MISEQNINNYINFLIDNYFPELKDKDISFKISKGKNFFMQTGIYPYFIAYFYKKFTIEIHRSSLKMNEMAFKGCLAHELEHISDLYKMKKWFTVSCTTEREIDYGVVKRGLKNELLELIKFHDKKYKKYKYEDGLTLKELLSFNK